MPLGYTATLDVCVDLRRAAWAKAKRRLTLAEQRAQAPPPLQYTGAEFLRIPRVKQLVRNGLLAAYSALFVLVLLTRVDTGAQAAAAASTRVGGFGAAFGSSAAATAVEWGSVRVPFVPWLPAWLLEAIFMWWTLNLLLDHASQHARQASRTLKLAVGATALDLVTLSLLVVSLAIAWRADLGGARADAGDAPPSPPGWGRRLEHDGEARRQLGAAVDASADAGDGAPHAALHGREWSVLLLGLCAIPMCIRSLRLLTEHRILGVLMIILAKMMCAAALNRASGSPWTCPSIALDWHLTISRSSLRRRLQVRRGALPRHLRHRCHRLRPRLRRSPLGTGAVVAAHPRTDVAGDVGQRGCGGLARRARLVDRLRARRAFLGGAR